MEVKDKLTTLESLKVAYDANRESINTLSEELLAQMGDVAQQSDVDALNARVTNLELNAGGDSNAEVVDARVSNSGTTYGTLKERLDEEYNQLTKELSGSLNATASALLINILRNAMYTADQSANITALEAALAMSGSSGDGGDSGGSEGDGGETVTTYSIVSALLHATSNNAAASVESGASYTATITADDGYNLDGATVSVSMGGVDITATAYSDGVVNIASVTGNVIITVNAVSIAVSEILYELAEPTTFDGTNSIDTGVALLANDISWSIVGELENLVDGQSIRFFEIGTDKMNEYKFKMEVTVNNAHGIRWSDKTVTCAKLIWLGQKAGNTAKFVITHEAGTNTIKYYGYHTSIAGKTERFDSELVRDNYVALEDTLSICTAGSFRMDTFGIYSRVYTADEITAYLGA